MKRLHPSVTWKPRVLTKQQKEERRLRGHELLHKGRTQAEVARELGVTEGAVSQWKGAAATQGKAALKARPHTGRKPSVDPKVMRRLPKLLLKGAESFGFEGEVWTLERVAAVIKKEFGQQYHPSHVSKILRKLGLTWKKPRTKPLQRDDAAIEAWVKKDWPRIKKGQPGSAL